MKNGSLSDRERRYFAPLAETATAVNFALDGEEAWTADVSH